MHDYEIGRCRCDDDHQNCEPDGGPSDGAQTLVVRRVGIDVGLIPVAGETGGERVERSAERAHGCGKNSRDQQAPDANGHFVKNEVAENLVRRFGKSWNRDAPDNKSRAIGQCSKM